MSALAGDLAAALDPCQTFRTYVEGDPEAWQRRVLLSTAARQALVCARQTGKSTTVSVGAAHTALYLPRSLVLIVAPTQRQSNETLAKVRVVLSRLTAVSGSQTEVRTENGSRIVALPGDETIRGFSDAELLLFEEAAWVEESTYVSAVPMVRRGGRIVAMTTPGARTGWFYERAWMDPQSVWERHMVTAEESARYTPADLVQKRREVGGRLFRAEYMCEFLGLREAAFDPEAVERAFSPHVRPLFEVAS